MAETNAGLYAVLEKVAKVTSNAAAELQSELHRLTQEKDRMLAHYDAAAERIRQSLHSLGQHVGLGRGAPARGRRGRGSSTARAGTRTARRRSVAPAKKGKRVRRGPAELKRDAEAVFQLIKSKGAEGTKGGDIRKRHPKVGQDIRAYVEKFSGHKLKTVGSKAAMRYIAA